jgi:hypothetical protein
MIRMNEPYSKIIDPKSIWNNETYQDWFDFKKIISISDESVFEFCGLLNSGYLDKKDKGYEYRPNKKWIDEFLTSNKDVKYELSFEEMLASAEEVLNAL